MRVVFVYPIIVVHEYNKNYLVRNFEMSDKILFSDNEKIEVSNQELIILKELIKNPERKLIDIAESTNIPIKTVIKIKKEMERKNIIKTFPTENYRIMKSEKIHKKISLPLIE